jgi:hypothetical protein
MTKRIKELEDLLELARYVEGTNGSIIVQRPSEKHIEYLRELERRGMIKILHKKTEDWDENEPEIVGIEYEYDRGDEIEDSYGFGLND